MRLQTTLITALIAVPLMAQTPVTSNDRVYSADQTSNTVSVIDPATQTLAGEIVLGAVRSEVLSPIYRGEANVHGLGFSPDHRTLVVVSNQSPIGRGMFTEAMLSDRWTTGPAPDLSWSPISTAPS